MVAAFVWIGRSNLTKLLGSRTRGELDESKSENACSRGHGSVISPGSSLHIHM